MLEYPARAYLGLIRQDATQSRTQLRQLLCGQHAGHRGAGGLRVACEWCGTRWCLHEERNSRSEHQVSLAASLGDRLQHTAACECRCYLLLLVLQVRET